MLEAEAKRLTSNAEAAVERLRRRSSQVRLAHG
jgi:hypothetical protein